MIELPQHEIDTAAQVESFIQRRVLPSNKLWEQQARLGPARLHHCLRAIGECEVLISLMVTSSQSRSTCSERVDEYSSTQAAISLSRIELDQCRLLVQRVAHLLDTIGNRLARKQISMIKVAVAKLYQDIADR